MVTICANWTRTDSTRPSRTDHRRNRKTERRRRRSRETETFGSFVKPTGGAPTSAEQNQDTDDQGRKTRGSRDPSPSVHDHQPIRTFTAGIQTIGKLRNFRFFRKGIFRCCCVEIQIQNKIPNTNNIISY